jgi:sulfite exporter TauE/SafE
MEVELVRQPCAHERRVLACTCTCVAGGSWPAQHTGRQPGRKQTQLHTVGSREPISGHAWFHGMLWGWVTCGLAAAGRAWTAVVVKLIKVAGRQQ